MLDSAVTQLWDCGFCVFDSSLCAIFGAPVEKLQLAVAVKEGLEVRTLEGADPFEYFALSDHIEAPSKPAYDTVRCLLSL
jgi:hypothetical protein